MISEIAYKSGLGLASYYAEQGLTLTTNPISLLGELVRLSVPAVETASPSLQSDNVGDNFIVELEDFGRAVAYNTEGSVNEPSGHTLEISSDIDALSKVITGHISYARTVVKPLVVEMADKLHNWKIENANFEPSKKFNIELLETPAIVKDQMFIGSLDAYKNKSVLKPDKFFDLNAIGPEQLLNLVMTGEDKSDTLINEWLCSMDPEFLSRVWINVFTSLPPVGGYGSELIIMSNISNKNVFEQVYISLAIYLISRKLYDSTDFTNEGVTLAEHRRIAAQYRDFAGALLNSSLVKLDLFSKANTLVVESNSERQTIKVNGDIYRPWLKSGGTPEIMLGLLISDQSVYTQSLIDQQKDKLLGQWQSYCNFSRTEESNRSFSLYKNYISILMDELMRDISEDEQTYIESNTAYFSKVKDLVYSELSQLVFKDMENPLDIALVFIAKCRFYYTSAYCILKDINQAQTINPDIDVREAALLAVINYIAGYITDQITISQ